MLAKDSLEPIEPVVGTLRDGRERQQTHNQKTGVAMSEGCLSAGSVRIAGAFLFHIPESRITRKGNRHKFGHSLSVFNL